MNTAMGLKTALALLGSLAFGTASATGTVQVPRNVPPVVSKARLVQHHNPADQLHISIALQLRNAAALDAYLHDLYDPASPSYHKFLSPQQFTAAYGPTQAQVNQVKLFLKQQGVTVDSVSANRTRVRAHASTAALESAFGVAVNDYSYSGRNFYSASTNPTLPAGIGAYTLSVMGLENASQLKAHSVQSSVPQPRGQGLTPSGFSPTQIATAYGWPSLTDTTQASDTNAHVNIAIVTAFTYRTADVQKFWKQYGLPTHTLTNIAIDGTTHRLNGETTLDVERSSSMAPGANMLVYEAVNPAFTAFDDAFIQAATDDNADVVSTSWGLAEQDTPFSSLQAEHEDFVQLSSQGIPVFAAAGDNGSADGSSGVDNADFPASDPFVVAAGGTTLALNDDDTISSESAWSGAGGADSLYFAEPSWQSTFTGNGHCDADHTGDFSTGGCAAASADSRQSSDMSMDADPATGYSIYYNGRWQVFGGTSFVAPELAGFFAIVTQRYRTSVGDSTARIGTANSLIYQDALANPGDFNDITVGSNGNFSAGSGWDHPTGWGTPHGASTMADDLQNLLPH